MSYASTTEMPPEGRDVMIDNSPRPSASDIYNSHQKKTNFPMWRRSRKGITKLRYGLMSALFTTLITRNSPWRLFSCPSFRLGSSLSSLSWGTFLQPCSSLVGMFSACFLSSAAVLSTRRISLTRQLESQPMDSQAERHSDSVSYPAHLFALIHFSGHFSSINPHLFLLSTCFLLFFICLSRGIKVAIYPNSLSHLYTQCVKQRATFPNYHPFIFI